MPLPTHRRRSLSLLTALLVATAITATSQAPATPAPAKPISARHLREADDAFLAGARQLTANDPAAAQKSFTRAVALNPTKPEYTQALAVATQHLVTLLVQQAAQARLTGHADQATKLLAQASALDPDSPIVAEHLAPPIAFAEPPRPPIGADEIARLGGPIHITPNDTLQSFHRRGDAQEILRAVYLAYGIRVTIDPSITPANMRFDLDNADFATATRIALMMANVFATPLEAKAVLLAKDTRENRDKFSAQIEETLFFPGLPTDQLTELSNVAKNIFDLKQVTVAQGGNALIIRGDEDSLQLANITFADILDGGADVMIEVHMYEVDKNRTRDIGLSLPTSISGFAIPAVAQNLVTQNQALIQQGVANGLDITTGTYYQILARELAFLYLAGVSIPQLTNILGTIGTIGSVNGVGIPLIGANINTTTTFNALLASSDVRSVDDVQLRVGDRQLATFRSGTRYPITTSTYSSGVSSTVASQLANVQINGVNVNSLLNSASAAANVPIFQYEDLGLTLKATPQVLKSGNISMLVDLKIEALGGGTINNIPILNSRQLTSNFTVPDGQTAMLASFISLSEMGAINGVAGLSEIPGFQGPDHNGERDTAELLITLTPHIIRKRSPVTATRRVLANLGPEAQ